MSDPLTGLSEALADRVAAANGLAVRVAAGRHGLSGVLWRDDVVVTSEQTLPHGADEATVVLPGGERRAARVAGRDPGTNVAALRLASPAAARRPAAAAEARVGSLLLALGADEAGDATARLALLHHAGPAWTSVAGGRVDRRLLLDARLSPAEEGGPVLTAAGALLGMSTFGPRRRALVIPAATVERVLDPLLAEGRVARGWLGLGLQPVAVPDALREAAGGNAGLMVLQISPGSPADQAGVRPGDILLSLDGQPVWHPRGLARLLGPDRVGQAATLRVLRGTEAASLTATIAPRPASRAAA